MPLSNWNDYSGYTSPERNRKIFSVALSVFCACFFWDLIIYYYVVCRILEKNGITKPIDGGMFTFGTVAWPVQKTIVVPLYSHTKFPKPKCPTQKYPKIVRKRVRKKRIKKSFPFSYWNTNLPLTPTTLQTEFKQTFPLSQIFRTCKNLQKHCKKVRDFAIKFTAKLYAKTALRWVLWQIFEARSPNRNKNALRENDIF